MPDEQVCREVTAFLANPPEQPFFCAAGLYKPHLPWHAPKRFFDLYPADTLTLPTVRDDDLDDVPSVARDWALNPADHKLVVGRGVWRQAVQGYLAAISYCDWIVGRLLDALDRSGLSQNTIVVLWGDNGFHLGEKLHWRKFVLWEEATRVPLIFALPDAAAARPFHDEPVGLVDLFPTLAELCGIAGPKGVDGRSLAGALRTDALAARPTVTTWGQGNHSVRSGKWRYSRYREGGEELYHHGADPREWTNLAHEPRFRADIEKLRACVPADG